MTHLEIDCLFVKGCKGIQFPKHQGTQFSREQNDGVFLGLVVVWPVQ